MIFVTGGDGLIGGALLRACAAEGADAEGAAWRGAGGLRALDLSRVAEAELPAGIETAVLCAWSGGVAECKREPERTRACNVNGNVALAARLRAGGAKIVFLSTSLVFSGAQSGPGDRVSPCCEYARQKALVEQALDPSVDAIVRLTKVGETLLPRLRGWAEELRSGTPVNAAPHLRLAPVLLSDVAAGLAWLAANFCPGVFQMSARVDHSYLEVARMLAERLGLPEDRVRADDSAGAGLFDVIPRAGSLKIAAPARCPVWPTGDDCLQILVEKAVS